MRKLLVISLAMCLVAFAANAFAEVQNIKVSGDIIVTGVMRDDFDLGVNYQEGTGDKDSDVIMSQARVRVDADLTDNVGATVRLINERDWDVEDATDDETDIDIDLAYITLKEMLYSPLTVTLGRQELRFGNGFIIGDVDTNRVAGGLAFPTNTHPSGLTNQDLSVRKAFDAVRATLDYEPLTIDLVYSKIDENNAETSPEKDDVDLMGLNATYDLGDDYGTTVEGYFWSKRDDSVKTDTGIVNNKADKIYAPGLRVSTNPIERLNVQTEVAWQLGTKDLRNANNATTLTETTRKREAMAVQVMGSYALDMDMSPILGASYTWLSGDKNPWDTTTTNNNDKYKAWDPMFEDQTAGHIINVLFVQSSSKVLNLFGVIEPMEDIKVKLDYTSIWFAVTPNNGVWGSSGLNLLNLYEINGGVNNPVMTGKDHLGQELDLTLTYDYTEDVQLGLLWGYFVPGNAFDGANRKNATELLASCKVLF